MEVAETVLVDTEAAVPEERLVEEPEDAEPEDAVAEFRVLVTKVESRVWTTVFK